MSLIWKPTLLVATALILLGAIYFKQPATSNEATTGGKAAAAISPADMMQSIGRLPETEIDSYQ